MPPVQVRAAGLAYVRSTRAWQLAENQRAPWKSAIFSGGWVRGATRSVLAGSPLTAALHPVTIVARGPVARVEKDILGVKGHCRVAEASRVAESAGDTALIRVRAGAGTLGPAQDPRSLACASPF